MKYRKKTEFLSRLCVIALRLRLPGVIINYLAAECAAYRELGGLYE